MISTKIICSMINRIVTTQQSKDSESAFFKIAAFGEFKGLSTTHLIVTSLVSASYISKNQQVIADITNTLTQLHQVAPEQFARSLIDPITRDKRATTNGISLLVQSLIAALDHGNKIEAMVDLLFFLTKHDPNAMSTVCKKDIVLDSEGQESISPLARLETVVHRITDEQNKTLIEHLIRTWSGLHQMNRNRFFMTSEATYDESLSRVELKPNSSR